MSLIACPTCGADSEAQVRVFCRRPAGTRCQLATATPEPAPGTFLDEGDPCPCLCGGTMELRLGLDGACYCAAGHAPCPPCEASFLVCSGCGWTPEDV